MLNNFSFLLPSFDSCKDLLGCDVSLHWLEQSTPSRLCQNSAFGFRYEFTFDTRPRSDGADIPREIHDSGNGIGSVCSSEQRFRGGDYIRVFVSIDPLVCANDEMLALFTEW